MCGFFSILGLQKKSSSLKFKRIKHILFLFIVLFPAIAFFGEADGLYAQDKPATIRVEATEGNIIEIFLPQPAQRNVRLLVTDVLGRNVKDSTIARLPEPGRIEVNLSGYRQGLYFIRVYYQQHIWYNRFLLEPASIKHD